ncbi:hypothetical protein [Methylobacterium sp. R2-1]|nr:hypothetical protein [Methylobacterium sp. R2-1]MBB2965111.1 hypothetical protein [Methylobacterium sp. R2-1]
MSCLTKVEKVLLISPSKAAARQLRPATEDQQRFIAQVPQVWL